MSDGKIIDFATRKAQSDGGTTMEAVKAASATYEFHIHPAGMSDGSVAPDPQTATGYLKFGPAFIAVVDSPADDSQVVFAVSTPMVRFVKKIEDGAIQGTLSL